MQAAIILLLIAVCIVLMLLVMIHIGFRAPRIRETATPAKFNLDYIEPDSVASGWINDA